MKTARAYHCRLRLLRFDFDSADLSARNRELLSRVAGFLLISLSARGQNRRVEIALTDSSVRYGGDIQ
jgi:outer membrane protein OmpA-like peptidoglycan-associated protein